MVQNPTGLSRELIIHPGETLAEVLSDKEMSQKELAERAGVSEKHVSTIINGTKPISVSFAKKLEYVVGVDASFWCNLQSIYDREILEFEEENNISEEELDVLKPLKMIIAYLSTIGCIGVGVNNVDKVLALRKLLGISNLTLIPQISYNAAYRANQSSSADLYVMFAWQRICEILTEDIEASEILDMNKLRESIPEIKLLMFKDPNGINCELTRIFSECGIAFKIVRHFTGAPVQGFIKRAEHGKMILCMTLRQSYADRFWFTLFHEIAHILNGDVKQKFVDFLSVKSEIEECADEFSRNVLMNSKEYKTFIDHGDFGLESIRKFAKSQNIMPYIVIGRLMKEEILDWGCYSGEMVKYKWVEETS